MFATDLVIKSGWLYTLCNVGGGGGSGRKPHVSLVAAVEKKKLACQILLQRKRLAVMSLFREMGSLFEIRCNSFF